MRTLTLEKKKDAPLHLRLDHIGNLTLTDVCFDHTQEGVWKHNQDGFSQSEWLGMDFSVHRHLLSQCKLRRLLLGLPVLQLDQRGADYPEENAAWRSVRKWRGGFENTPYFEGVLAFWQLDPDQLDQMELSMAILEL